MNGINLNPKQLRMFLLLAESLNFSKTAEQLFMTQPSLSKAIRQLDNTLDLPLFERTTRSVHLTAGGTRLIPLARAVVGEYEAGLQRILSSAEREAMQLSIAAWPSLAYALVPELCATLEHRYPSARIDVQDYVNSACLERVLAYQADFALASVAPSHLELNYQELLRDRFVLLACGKWRSHLASRMHLKDLSSLPLLTLSNGSTAMRYMSAAYLQRGVEYQPKMQVDQVSTLAGLVKKEIGIAVLPYLGVLPILGTLGPRGVQIAEITDGPLRSVGIVSRRQGKPTSIAHAAMQEIQIVCQRLMHKHPGWVLAPSAHKRKLR